MDDSKELSSEKELVEKEDPSWLKELKAGKEITHEDWKPGTSLFLETPDNTPKCTAAAVIKKVNDEKFPWTDAKTDIEIINDFKIIGK